MFGKVLVCIHLGLSLILATWAMALYTTRIDWTAKKGTPPATDGELVARMAEYERLSKGFLRQSDVRWRDVRFDLEDNEIWRPIERPWYARELEFLRSADADKTVSQVYRDATGDAIPVKAPVAPGPYLEMGPLKDREGNLYKDRDGQDLKLRSLDFYNKNYDATVAQVTTQVNLIQDAIKRDQAATDKLKGPKGLQHRIAFERVKTDRAKEEYGEVRPLLLKTAVELQNLEQLRSRLEERLRELRSKGDAEK